jgi:multisubunit Na+/H+ antiporter MnhB subunit
MEVCVLFRAGNVNKKLRSNVRAPQKSRVIGKGLMRRIATLVVVGIVLMLPGSALATGSSTCQAYNPQSCPPTEPVSSGTLPFTGLDVVLLVAGGGTLLAAGFVVRRLSRRLD